MSPLSRKQKRFREEFTLVATGDSVFTKVKPWLGGVAVVFALLLSPPKAFSQG